MMSVVARWWWVGVLYYYSVFLLEIEFTLRCSLRNGHELCRAKKTEEKHVFFIFHCWQIEYWSKNSNFVRVHFNWNWWVRMIFIDNFLFYKTNYPFWFWAQCTSTILTRIFFLHFFCVEKMFSSSLFLADAGTSLDVEETWI